jgi:thiosulfate/3-mercaptopyruvate sulfurtransferase
MEYPKVNKGKFSINLNSAILTDVFYVKSKMYRDDVIIVDSRAPERYRGEVEPIDKKAGHIPGAKNYHWKDVLNEKLCFKSKEDLKEHFRELEKYKEIILQCGSGIDACGNFAALDELGLKPKLYLGSWSDWVSYDDNPVATGEE